MRAIKIMLFIVISSVMSSVHAQSYQDVKKAMTKASQVAVAGFRESRVSGMIEKYGVLRSTFKENVLL